MLLYWSLSVRRLARSQDIVVTRPTAAADAASARLQYVVLAIETDSSSVSTWSSLAGALGAVVLV